MKTTKPAKKLTLKQRKLIKARAEGKTLKEAGKIAGFSPKSAEQQACMELKKPEVSEAFSQLIDRYCPDSLIGDTYLECMTATKVISANIIAKNGEGMADANSMTKDFVDVPDYPTRLKAADSVTKLKGYMVDNHNVNVDGASMAEVAAYFTEKYGADKRAKI